MSLGQSRQNQAFAYSSQTTRQRRKRPVTRTWPCSGSRDCGKDKAGHPPDLSDPPGKQGSATRWVIHLQSAALDAALAKGKQPAELFLICNGLQTRVAMCPSSHTSDGLLFPTVPCICLLGAPTPAQIIRLQGSRVNLLLEHNLTMP